MDSIWGYMLARCSPESTGEAVVDGRIVSAKMFDCLACGSTYVCEPHRDRAWVLEWQARPGCRQCGTCGGDPNVDANGILHWCSACFLRHCGLHEVPVKGSPGLRIMTFGPDEGRIVFPTPEGRVTA